MPTRWVDLLLRINYVIDDADDKLSEGERNLFFAHLLATATRRQTQPRVIPIGHPMPGFRTDDCRDPSGE